MRLRTAFIVTSLCGLISTGAVLAWKPGTNPSSLTPSSQQGDSTWPRFSDDVALPGARFEVSYPPGATEIITDAASFDMPDGWENVLFVANWHNPADRPTVQLRIMTYTYDLGVWHTKQDEKMSRALKTSSSARRESTGDAPSQVRHMLSNTSGLLCETYLSATSSSYGTIEFELKACDEDEALESPAEFGKLLPTEWAAWFDQILNSYKVTG